MSRDEGVIKFECRFLPNRAPDETTVAALIDYRQRLFKLGLIGVYPDGIGYGNISVRGAGNVKFIISASQTGHLAQVSPEHFSDVTAYSVDENWVQCSGVQKASSESLTHAMIYDTFPAAGAVVHVHNTSAWERLLEKIPTTHRDVPYGTPAMGREVQRLARESDLEIVGIFVMAGHQDGILSFGKDLAQAFSILTSHLEVSSRNS